ncbi:MAG: sulfatase-like hydrolase/transferase [Flavobacteriaceae bacterium]
MSQKIKIYVLLFFVVPFFYTCNKVHNSKNQRFNIVVIIVDQLSAKVMSNAGCSWVKTPAMDQLASEGVKFTNAYTSFPLCSPARASFLTANTRSKVTIR